MMFGYVKKQVQRLLNYSGEITGTDNIYIARHGFWTTLGYGLSTIIGLATLLVYANTIPKELYGTYKYILALVGGLGFLTLSGINTAVAQAVARGYNYALIYAVRIQWVWNSIYMAVALGVAGWYLWHGNTVFGWSVAILALALPLTATLNTYSPYLSGKKEFRLASIIATLSSLFTSAIIFIAILTTRNIVIWVGAYAIGNLLPNAFFYWYTARHIQKHSDPAENAGLMRFAGHISMINILSLVGGYLDKILLFQYVGPVAVATYAFSSIGTDRLKGWLKSIASILLPRLTERSLAEIDQVFYRRVLQAAVFGLAASALYIFLIPSFFALLFPKYLESVFYSQVLSLSMIGAMVGGYTGQVFTAHKMLRTIYFSAVGTHGLRIVLFVILGYFWGIWGMVWATLLMQTLGIGYTLILWEVAMRREGLRQR